MNDHKHLKLWFFSARAFALIPAALFIVSALSFAPADAIVLTSGSEDMKANSTCQRAGRFQLTFDKNDYDIIVAHLATEDYVFIRATFFGEGVAWRARQPVLCRNIEGGRDLPWQDGTVVLDVIDEEVSDISTPDGVPDVEAFVFGQSGRQLIEIFITDIQPAADWNDITTHPWIMVGLYERVVGKGDGLGTAMCVNAIDFGGLATLHFSMDIIPWELTYNTSDNQIGHFIEGPDGDGVDDEEEQGPDGQEPNYDGNDDGASDWLQGNVSSFHTRTKVRRPYITIAAQDGFQFAGPRSISDYGTVNQWVTLPYGFFSFQLLGFEAGAEVSVTIFPDDSPTQSFYVYGKTLENKADHWYEFSYDGNTGAEMVDDTLVLHFIDGERGDCDLSANGRIETAGAPALVESHQVLFFPYLTDEDGDHVQMSILNCETYTVGAILYFYDQQGASIIQVALSLSGWGKRDICYDEIPSGAATAIVVADGDLAGYARIESASGQKASWPAGTSGGLRATVPHVAVGNNWQTQIAIQNINDSGMTLWLGGASGSIQNVSVPAYGRKTIVFSKQTPLSYIGSQQQFVAMLMFESMATGADRAALLLDDRKLAPLCVPEIYSGAGRSTAVALVNTNSDGPVSAFAYDDTGVSEEIYLGIFETWNRIVMFPGSLATPSPAWAWLEGSISMPIPFCDPNMYMQGLAIYAEGGMAGFGAVKLNKMQFSTGLIPLFASDDSGFPQISFSFANPGETDAAVHVISFLNDRNTVLTDSELTIGAGRNWIGDLLDLFTEETAPFEPTHVRIRSDQPLHGFQTYRHADWRMEALPVLRID